MLWNNLMLSVEQDRLIEFIKEEVEENWEIKGRPDLFEDCTQYVIEILNYNESLLYHFFAADIIKDAMLSYFQSISYNATSNEDMNNMANQYH